jgi:hypothetical protein
MVLLPFQNNFGFEVFMAVSMTNYIYTGVDKTKNNS